MDEFSTLWLVMVLLLASVLVVYATGIFLSLSLGRARMRLRRPERQVVSAAWLSAINAIKRRGRG